MKAQITKAARYSLAISAAALILIGWGGAARAHDDDRHDSDAKGPTKSTSLLTVFEDTYWRWAYGGGTVTLPTDQNGNAVLAGVVLMPLPNAPGDGTPGSIDVTLKAGQEFFLPVIGQLGTSYTTGAAPDPFLNGSKVFGKKNLKLNLKLDGKTILDQDDALDFYSEFSFDPPIPLNFDAYDSIIYFQGVGLLHAPLSPGKHVIKLDVKLPLPAPFNYPIEYHNTFNVTVQAKGH